MVMCVIALMAVGFLKMGDGPLSGDGGNVTFVEPGKVYSKGTMQFKTDASRRAAFANMRCTRASKADTIANNIVVGSAIDDRTPLAITDDMRKQSEQVVCKPSQWMKEKSRKDLMGWDDKTIPTHADRFDAPHKKMEKELKNMFPNSEISGRVKTMPSLVGKLKTKNKLDPPFTHTDMEDISGLRVTFDNIKELKEARKESSIPMTLDKLDKLMGLK